MILPSFIDTTFTQTQGGNTMIRIDKKSMDVFVNPITLVDETALDECIEGVEQLLGALKFAKKNGKQVYADARERQREGKEPWPFIRYRVAERDWKTAVAPPAAQQAGSWK
jgi:hypothetical protein